MSLRPHVAHVTTAHMALDARIFHKEAVSAARSGFRVVVIGDHPRPETIDGVEIRPLRRSPSRLLRRVQGPLAGFFAALGSGARVVHFHDPEFIPAGVALKLMGRKVVYDAHEYYSEVQAHRVSGSPLLQGVVRALASLFLEQIPARLFDRVVFPTYMLRDAVYPGTRSEVLVNLLALDVIADQKRTPVTPDHDVVFVGSISPFRAGPLMEMMKHILLKRSDARLLMVGAPEATVRWMRENAPSPEVIAAITFHPRVPHAEVKSLLARGKIGFDYHPMQRRFQVALPMKVYEYMAVELPVVITRFPELERQFVEDEEIIFVDGDDQQEYASAVLRLLGDAEVSRRLGRAGYERLLSEHNWEASEARKLAAMYEALLET